MKKINWSLFPASYRVFHEAKKANVSVLGVIRKEEGPEFEFRVSSISTKESERQSLGVKLKSRVLDSNRILIE